MKRFHSLFAVALIVLGVAFARSSSRANDDEAVATDRTEEISSQLELVGRIEALERRIARLEAGMPLVRQVDNRESPPYAQPRALSSASVRTGSDDDVDDQPNITNGQTWRIRMLGHRQTKDME